MNIKKLKIISKPQENTRTVINAPTFKEPLTPLFEGKDDGYGDIDMVCGNKDCSKLLVKAVFKNTIHNIVICCPKCGSYNEIE